MYDLILKPLTAFFLVTAGLFVFHVYGPNIASSICPVFGEEDSVQLSRCIGFFDILQ